LQQSVFARFSRVHAADIDADALGDHARRARGRVSPR